jgi:heme-degrading monooxygenase HmoA
LGWWHYAYSGERPPAGLFRREKEVCAHAREDEGLRDVREHVLPLLQQHDGFKGFIALGNRQSGELIGITFWESEQAMQASEEVGDRMRSDTAQDTGDVIEDVERYEVGLFEMSD